MQLHLTSMAVCLQHVNPPSTVKNLGACLNYHRTAKESTASVKLGYFHRQLCGHGMDWDGSDTGREWMWMGVISVPRMSLYCIPCVCGSSRVCITATNKQNVEKAEQSISDK